MQKGRFVLRFRQAWKSAAVVCHLGLLSVQALGQQDVAQVPTAEPQEPLNAARTTSEAPASIEEAKPPVYWLPDEQGELRPVLGFTLEDFRRLVDLQKGLDRRATLPQYSVEEVSLSGRIVGDRAQLTVQVDARLHAEGSVAIPLAMGETTLRQRVVYEGTGESVVATDHVGGGFVWHLRGPEDAPHRLTLSVFVPVERVGAENQLNVSLPQSVVSRCELLVPEKTVEAHASNGSIVEARTEESGSLLTVYGASDALGLRWRATGEPNVKSPAALEVVGGIIARIDSRNVSTVATLRVKSHAAPLARFRVRLPKGARLVSGDGSGYVAESLDRNPVVRALRNTGPLIEVRLDEPAREETEVRLVTEQSHDPGRADVMVDLAGFEVLDAVRQSGHIAVAVLGDWQPVWGPRRSIRQVAVTDLPSDLQDDDVMAGFEYLNQPCSLMARITPRRSRVGVEPAFVYQVDAHRLLLEARLKYTIRGARVFALELDLPRPEFRAQAAATATTVNWEIEELGPPDLVDVTGVVLEQGAPIIIPLLQPTMGQVELHLRASCPIPETTDVIAFELPRPTANTLGGATVVVVPADDVELAPRLEGTIGLSRQPPGAIEGLPQRQRPPLVYRGDLREARFACDFHVHNRRVDVSASSTVNVARQRIEVEQTFTYEIAYQPMESIALECPSVVSASDSLEAELDGESIAVSGLRTVVDDVRSRRVLALPNRRIGPLRLTLRYSLPNVPIAEAQSSSARVPLIMPNDGILQANELLLEVQSGLTAEPDSSRWIVSAPPFVADANDLPRRFSSTQRTREVALEISMQDPLVLNTTTVHRAWIQTALLGDTRRDRAVFYLTSRNEKLVIAPPDGAEISSVRIRLDSQDLRPVRRRDGAFEIPLSNGSLGRPQVLEVRYQFDDTTPTRGLMALAPPRLIGPGYVSRTYWQLLLPRGEHIVTPPTGLTPEFTWGWEGVYWGRRPLLEQFGLENWVAGDSSIDVLHRPAPPQRTNRYVFGAVGAPGTLHIRTAPRSLIVLTASGAALVVGLLLMYTRWLRYRVVLLVGLMGLLALAVVFPEPTLLLAQAASIGLVLSIVAGLLKLIVTRPRRATSMRQGRSSAVYDLLGSTPGSGRAKVPGSTQSEELDLELTGPPTPDR